MSSFRTGVLAGLATGALWGFPFLAPRLNPSYSPAAIALGRFAFYAIFSLIALLPALPQKRFRATYFRPGPLAVALVFGLIGNGLYYTLVSYSVQKVGISTTSLIVGLIPLAVAFAGVQSLDELKRALLPCALIGLGVLLLHHNLGGSPAEFASAGAALFLWSAFAVLNSIYLKKNPEIRHGEWASLLGISSLLALCIFLYFFDHGVAFSEVAIACLFRDRVFLVSSLVLGCGSSWLANGLWNRASQILPTSILGQLIVFETVFALIYGFIYERRLPGAAELTAAVLMVLGVTIGIRALRNWHVDCGLI